MLSFPVCVVVMYSLFQCVCLCTVSDRGPWCRVVQFATAGTGAGGSAEGAGTPEGAGGLTALTEVGGVQQARRQHEKPIQNHGQKLLSTATV